MVFTAMVRATSRLAPDSSLYRKSARAPTAISTDTNTVRQMKKVVNSGSSGGRGRRDRKSTRLNSSHVKISYAVFCLKKKKQRESDQQVNSERLATSQKP